VGMKIIAIPNFTTPGMGGSGLSGEQTRVIANAPAHDYQVVTGYTSLADLIAKIKPILDADNFNCMELLEIDAHGNPNMANGITHANAATFGTLLRTLNLCDTVDIYLSGCNTGVNVAGNIPVAQAISANAPTVANDNIQVTVYGSVGYMSSTNMEGNGRTSRDATTSAGYFPPYPDASDGIHQGVYPGSYEAVGSACFRAFREGNRI